MKFGNLVTGTLAVLGVASCAFGARADYKVTVGVGHMCCGTCKKDATAALTPLASGVTIEGKSIIVVVKENDVAPVLTALRNAGFPPLHVDAGGAAVTIAVGHMCCAHCVSDLKQALVDAKIDALNTDDMNIGMGKMVVKAKEGKSLDLMAVISAMETGGFSATKITMGNAVVVNRPAGSVKLASAAKK